MCNNVNATIKSGCILFEFLLVLRFVLLIISLLYLGLFIMLGFLFTDAIFVPLFSWCNTLVIKDHLTLSHLTNSRSIQILRTWVFRDGRVREGSRGCGTFWELAGPLRACDVVRASGSGRTWSCPYSGDCCQGSLHDGSEAEQKKGVIYSTSKERFHYFHLVMYRKLKHSCRASLAPSNLSEAAVLLPESRQAAQGWNRGVTLTATGFSRGLTAVVIVVPVQVVVTRRAQQGARRGQGAGRHASVAGVGGGLSERHWGERERDREQLFTDSDYRV